jgi:hypothetical protein
MNRNLFSPDPADGGNSPAPASAAEHVPPPAAAAVISGTKTEAQIKLEQDLKDERDRHANTEAEKKKREIRISELEDELRVLRSAQSGRPASPAKRGIMEDFLFPE